MLAYFQKKPRIRHNNNDPAYFEDLREQKLDMLTDSSTVDGSDLECNHQKLKSLDREQ